MLIETLLSAVRRLHILAQLGISSPHVLGKLRIPAKIYLPGDRENVQKCIILSVIYGESYVVVELRLPLRVNVNCAESRDDVFADTWYLIRDPISHAKHVEPLYVPYNSD